MTPPSQSPVHLSRACTKSYREKVAQIIRTVQLEAGESDFDTAERLGCSVGTIRNARNGESDLSGVYLIRIEQEYGHSSLDPLLGLANSRAVPREAAEADALPPLTAAVHKIALARSPDSPGGVEEVHTELLDMLLDLYAAQRAINWMLAKAERIAA